MNDDSEPDADPTPVDVFAEELVFYRRQRITPLLIGHSGDDEK